MEPSIRLHHGCKRMVKKQQNKNGRFMENASQFHASLSPTPFLLGKLDCGNRIRFAFCIFQLKTIRLFEILRLAFACGFRNPFPCLRGFLGRTSRHLGATREGSSPRWRRPSGSDFSPISDSSLIVQLEKI
ncbi:hypothetical protein TNIN_377691 [Trichonephila inaurata madagascariensis]|uniref:Uncharacterized protein n=1 Tax=Trichonephila inaurata madagascariensis TaxID=2747483 RepID=A0A8X6YEA2_9ARAC|nr:hypothetical protein TNIN_377691 [Trichonephila inaurata madagascariensis]